MPEIMAEVWLCPGCPSAKAGFKSVRIIFEVSPALNVRMSIRFAGPHFDTTNNHDQAAAIPRRLKTPTLTQRDLLTFSLIIIYPNSSRCLPEGTCLPVKLISSRYPGPPFHVRIQSRNVVR